MMHRIDPKDTIRVRRSDIKRIYLKDHPLAFTLGLIAVLSSLAYLFFPHVGNESALVVSTSSFVQHAWFILCGIGGAALAAGIYYLKPNWETLGLVLLSVCMFVNFYAIVDVRGAGAGFNSFINLGAAIGFGTRALFVLQDQPRDKFKYGPK